MERLIKEQYIPLTSRPLGEHHSLCQVLTASRGLLNLGVFGTGSRKGGALRALIQPFSLCFGELHFDPVRKLWRLMEGQSLEIRDSFHLYLNKYYAALFWTDLIRKSHAAGGDKTFFQLTLDYFRDLDSRETSEIPGIVLVFLAHFLELEGILPDRNQCARCGAPAPVSKALCYTPQGQIICRRCRLEALPVLSLPARTFLNQKRGGLSHEDLQGVKAYLMGILSTVFSASMNQDALSMIFGNPDSIPGNSHFH